MKLPFVKILFTLSLLLLGAVALRAEVEMTAEMADRYETMLLTNPGPGVAWDRVIEWYATRGGGLETLQTRWETAASEDQTASHLMALGLLAERMRQPAEAVERFREAMEKSGGAANAARLLAALEAREGRFAGAVEAYEVALKDKSLSPLERMDVLRELARVHQRAFEMDAAVKVWERALKEFPGDALVMEQAAAAFVEGGRMQEARATLAQLSDAVRNDPFRRVATLLQIASVEEADGNREAALKIYNDALNETSDGNWFNREIRARIESAFRRADDLPGLLEFYDSRLAEYSRDVTSLTASADVLFMLGRSDEGNERLRRAVALAPDDIAIRLSLARRLEANGNRADALAELAPLLRSTRVDAEVLLYAGNLHWLEYEASGAEHSKADAISHWEKMAPPETRDAGLVARLAEVFAEKDLMDLAVREWKRLLEIYPAAADARLRLARHYLDSGAEAEAHAVLNEMTAGASASAEDYQSLARIQSQLDLDELALETLQAGLVKFPDNYELLSRAWMAHMDLKDVENALALFERLWASAPNAFFAEDVVRKYVMALENTERKDEILAELRDKLENGLGEGHVQALFHVALDERRKDEAEQVLKVMQASGRPGALRAEANYERVFGDLQSRIAVLRRLAAAEPRMATSVLSEIAAMESAAGEWDAAEATARELIQSAPADASSYRLLARLFNARNRFDDAISALQEGIRYAGQANALRQELADLQMISGRLDDAYSTLQEAFEREEGGPARMSVFRRMVEVSRANGKLDELVESLRERQRKETGGGRYGAYLAEVFLQMNDFASAREELMKSLGREPDDPQAVEHLIVLAEREGNQEEQMRLVERLVELTPTNANRARLIELQFRAGQQEEALLALRQERENILASPGDWSGVLQALRAAGERRVFQEILDSILAHGSAEPASNFEIALLQFSAGEYESAAANLRTIALSPQLGPAVLKAMESKSSLPAGVPEAMRNMHSMQTLQSFRQQAEARLNLILSQQHQSRSFSRMARMMGMPATPTLTRDEAVVLEAFFMLVLLSSQTDALGLEKNLTSEWIKTGGLDAWPRFYLAQTLQEFEILVEAITELAAEATPLDATQAQLLLHALNHIPADYTPDGVREQVVKAFERTAPEDAFRLRLTEFLGQKKGSEEEISGEVLNAFFEDPALTPNPRSYLLLVQLCHAAKDLDKARETLSKLYDMVDEEERNSPPVSPQYSGMSYRAQANSWSILLLKALIDEERNGEAHEQLGEMIEGGSLNTWHRHGSRFHIHQGLPDLQRGLRHFPWSVFQQFMHDANDDTRPRREAFFEEFPENDLIRAVARFYVQWARGERTQALEALMADDAVVADPEVATVILEAAEIAGQHDTGLAVVDTAALADGETQEMRSIRKLRLMRQAGQRDAASKLAESLAKRRLPQELSQILAQELRELGIDQNQFVMRSTGRQSHRSPRSQNSVVKQLQELINQKKLDEAERVGLQVLRRPFPSAQNHNERGIRQNVINLLQNAKRLVTYREQLDERLQANPLELDALARLLEADTQNRADIVKNRVMPALEELPLDQLDSLGAVLEILQNSNHNKEAAQIYCRIIERDSGHAFLRTMPLTVFINQRQENAIVDELAKTLAGLSHEDFQKLTLPEQISGNSQLPATILWLADQSVFAGQRTVAINLLERMISQSSNALIQHGARPLGLRLAELYLEENQHEKAKEAILAVLDMFPEQQPTGMPVPVHVQSFENFVMNSLRPFNLNEPSILDDLVRLSLATGMFEELLNRIQTTNEEQAAVARMILLTTARDTAALDFWKPDVSKDSIRGMLDQSFFYLIVEMLDWPEAKSLVPVVLEIHPFTGNFTGGPDQGFSFVTTLLQGGDQFLEDQRVRNYLQNLITSLASNPQYAPHYVHSIGYLQALEALLAKNFLEEAETLLAVTESARKQRNLSHHMPLTAVVTRLKALKNGDVAWTIAAAVMAAKGGGDEIRWQIQIPAGTVQMRRSEPEIVERQALRVHADHLPSRLEVYAGETPGSMKRIETLRKPTQSGSFSIESLPGELGVFQFRWEDKEGNARSSFLFPYFKGENLMDDLVTLSTDDAGKSVFEKGGGNLTGPFQSHGISTYDFHQSGNEYVLPLTSIEPEPGELYVVSGWHYRPAVGGSYPSVFVRSLKPEVEQSRGSMTFRHNAGNGWQQFFVLLGIDAGSFGQSLDSSIKELELGLTLRASMAVSRGYVFKGEFSDMRLTRIGLPDRGNVRDEFSQALREEDAAVRASRVLELIAVDPAAVFSSGHKAMLELFEKADRLGDLFEVCLNPALYMNNPLERANPAIWEQEFFIALAAAATAANAPASAAKWLKLVESLDLQPGTRFVTSAAALLGKSAALDDESWLTGFQKVTGMGGFDESGDILCTVWANSPAINQLTQLLDETNRRGLGEELRNRMRQDSTESTLLAAKQAIEAYLLAPVDAGLALELWSNSARSQRSNNSASFSSDAMPHIFGKIALAHPDPAAVATSARTMLLERHNDSATAQHELADWLHKLSLESRSDEHLQLWMTEEFASLGFQNRSVDRDRVARLVREVLASGDAAKMAQLQSIYQRSPDLPMDDPVREEFENLQRLLAIYQGDFSGTHPVAWLKSEANDGLVEVAFQWCLKKPRRPGVLNDTQVAVVEIPNLKSLHGQSSVELHFGSMPAELKKVAELKGDAIQGSLRFAHPATSGFLRVVATVNGERIEGPLVPLLHGTRIFPATGETLKD